MRIIAMMATIIGLLVTGLSVPLRAQPADFDGPCGRIRAVCMRAGFVPGGARAGYGLERDCVQPIIGGWPQPPQAARPLPRINPRVVAACRASNPNFGPGAGLGPNPRGPGLGGPGVGTEPGGPGSEAGPGPNAPSPETQTGPAGPSSDAGPGPGAGPNGGPCDRIRTACKRAGFMPGAAKTGMGMQADCIRPIMAGTPQPPRARQPLPRISQRLVTACRASDPSFGQRRGEPSGPSAAPPPAGAPDQGAPPPPVATPEQAAPPPPAGAPEQGAPPPPANQPLPETLLDPPTQAGAEAVPDVPSQRGAGRRPNIVFVLTDDLSMNLLQYMPHVLQMEKDGVTFANYFVTDSLCCPSRSSIFTGRYPHDTGVFTNTGDDGGYAIFRKHELEKTTFAAALAASGYHTALLGKYLNGYQPENGQEPGWTSWAAAGNGYWGYNYSLNEDGHINSYGNDPPDYLTDVVSGIGTRLIRQSADTPFMIEIATFAPHRPATPAPRDADAFPGLRAPRTAAFDAAPDANSPQWLKQFPPLSQRRLVRIDKIFRKRAQSVRAVDAMIGELQTAVAAIGQQDNTYFVFSSDNGFHLGEHRLWSGKMTAFDTDIHVPLIVTGPGVPAGRIVDEIAENIDLCPTFEELGGAATPTDVEGPSLVPLLHGQAVSRWRTAALIEHHGPVKDPDDPDMPEPNTANPPSYEAIRTATATYVEYVTGEKEYHDLAADPNELHNTYSSLDGNAKASMHALLSAIQNCHDAESCSNADRSDRSAMQR